MKNNKRQMTSHSEHLDNQYGKKGTQTRDKFESEFDIFMLGAKIQEMRQEKGMTQTELAEKCGTTKTYISRIENNSSDIRLSTLSRIINQGFGGLLKLNMNL
jgi:HTH-type transcriptional regulator / antitoxin HipB